MTDFAAETYRWGEGDPEDAARAFLDRFEGDERDRERAVLEVVDGDDEVLGTATVSASDLPGDPSEVRSGTSVFHVRVRDGKIIRIAYDADLSERYHERLRSRLERLSDDES